MIQSRLVFRNRLISPYGRMLSAPRWWRRKKRPHVDLLDPPLVGSDFDVFAQAKRVVHQEKPAGDDVAHQRLRAEADRDADDAGAGEQRQDVDAERGQHRHRRHHHDGDEDQRAKKWQQRSHPRSRDVGAFIALRRQPAVDRRFHGFPDQVREQQDDADAEQRAGDLAPHALLRKRRHVEVPDPRDQQQAGENDHDMDRMAKHCLVGGDEPRRESCPRLRVTAGSRSTLRARGTAPCRPSAARQPAAHSGRLAPSDGSFPKKCRRSA